MNRKIIVPLLLASLTGGVVATIPQNMSVQAEDLSVTEVRGGLVEITGFNSKGDMNSPFTLPTVTVYDDLGAEVTLGAGELITTLISPAGKDISDEIVAGVFTPAQKGIYTLTYSTNIADEVKTVSEPLKITISGDDYTMTLPENSQHVIPSIIPTSTELKIPTPVVELGDETLTNVVDVLGTEGVKVYVASNSSTVDITDTYNASGDYFTWTATEVGVYEIRYEYIVGSNVEHYLTQRFVVRSASDYDTDDIELQFTYDPSRPTSAVLGVETTLPSLNITDKNTGNEIEGYTSINVYYVDEQGNETDLTDELDGFNFTPTIAGDYKFVYKASVPLFDLESPTHTFYIKDVQDTVNPTITVVNNYEYDSNTGEVTVVYDADGVTPIYQSTDTFASDEDREEALTDALGNLRYDVPSVAVRNVSYTQETESGTETLYKAVVDIPAIYATDNFSDLSGLTFRREVRKDGSASTIKVVDSNEYADNETATIEFTQDGSYTVRYIATDEAGNERMTTFDIEVYAEEESLKTDGSFELPTISMPTMPTSIETDESLTFNTPTATDKYDTRVEVKTYYYFDNDVNTLYEVTETNDDGQLVIDLSDITIPSGATKIKVVTRAYNDYAYDDITLERQYSQLERSVALVDTSDADAPVFENSDTFLSQLQTLNSDIVTEAIAEDGYLSVSGGEPFSQGDEIVLPSLNVSDTTDSRLSLSITIINPHGQNVSPSGLEISQGATTGAYNYTISNASFTASYAGVYTVTYTAKDSGGNIVVRTFGIKVKDTAKPSDILYVLDSMTSIEIGQEVVVPTISLKDNGLLITDLGEPTSPDNKQAGVAGYNWELEIISGNAVVKSGTSFVATEPGEFRIVYTAWDASGLELVKKSNIITASDTTAPTIVLENGYDSFYGLGVAYDENTYITIPGIKEIYDGVKDEYIQSGDIDLDVKVTGPVSDEEVTLVTDEVTGDYSFLPTSGQGVYTITYTATDIYGNETVNSQTLAVGDTEAPTLVWDNEADDVITTATVGDRFVLNFDNATITDDNIVYDYDDTDNITLTVVVKDPSNSTVTTASTGDYIYDLDEVGTYTATITVADEAGNINTYSYNIEVSAEEADSNVVDSWVGAVVISASVLLVAGVVVYFVITNKDGSLKGKKGKSNRKR